MKAELITNVSHDLKTPLTSIINYVDLLKKEEVPGEGDQDDGERGENGAGEVEKKAHDDPVGHAPTAEGGPRYPVHDEFQAARASFSKGDIRVLYWTAGLTLAFLAYPSPKRLKAKAKHRILPQPMAKR